MYVPGKYGKSFLIQSRSSDFTKDLDVTLNLNAGYLPENRYAAWRAFRTSFKKACPQSYGAKAMLEYFCRRYQGDEGKLPEYAGVIEQKMGL